MPRYINEDDFCEYIRKNTTPSGAEWFISKIKDMPSADVVEIIRCKDCKSFKGGCCAKCGDDTTTFEPDKDFYCKYGERKETDA